MFTHMDFIWGSIYFNLTSDKMLFGVATKEFNDSSATHFKLATICENQRLKYLYCNNTINICIKNFGPQFVYFHKKYLYFFIPQFSCTHVVLPIYSPSLFTAYLQPGKQKKKFSISTVKIFYPHQKFSLCNSRKFSKILTKIWPIESWPKILILSKFYS